MKRVWACLLIACATRLSGAVVVELPKESSYYEPPPIRITGLAPLAPITLRVSCADGAGTKFTSSTRYVAGTDGVVDPRESIAFGDVRTLDPLAPFWSLSGPERTPFVVTAEVATTVEVVDRKQQVVATGTFVRRMLPSDVTTTELRKPASNLVGRYYEHEGGTKRPAVLVLTGSNGGIDERMGPFLASNGYNVLSLAYFHFEGLGDDLLDVPLEYFRDALVWLRSRPSIDPNRVAIAGASKGAEAALVVAASYPELVRAVVAGVPSNVVWNGMDARSRFGGDAQFASPDRSSWSLSGKPLPFVRRVLSEQRLNDPPLPGTSADVYEEGLNRPIDDAAYIPVERIRGPIFLAASGNDLVWPSLRMARAIEQRLKKKNFRYRVELREYPLAGHQLSPPGAIVGKMPGGVFPEETARAGADAWTKALVFLKSSLK